MNCLDEHLFVDVLPNTNAIHRVSQTVGTSVLASLHLGGYHVLGRVEKIGYNFSEEGGLSLRMFRKNIEIHFFNSDLR